MKVRHRVNSLCLNFESRLVLKKATRKKQRYGHWSDGKESSSLDIGARPTSQHGIKSQTDDQGRGYTDNDPLKWIHFVVFKHS